MVRICQWGPWWMAVPHTRTIRRSVLEWLMLLVHHISTTWEIEFKAVYMHHVPFMWGTHKHLIRRWILIKWLRYFEGWYNVVGFSYNYFKTFLDTSILTNFVYISIGTPGQDKQKRNLGCLQTKLNISTVTISML